MHQESGVLLLMTTEQKCQRKFECGMAFLPASSPHLTAQQISTPHMLLISSLVRGCKISMHVGASWKRHKHGDAVGR